MLKTIKTIIAVAALSGTVGANVHAEGITDQKDNSLSEQSQVHNASIENIINWNNISQPGEILKIATQKHYTAKQGDTLLSIANENQVSPQELIAWNDLYTNLIHPGLNLVIYDNSVTPNQVEPVQQMEANSPANVTTPTPAAGQTTEAAVETTGSIPVNTQQQDASQSAQNAEVSVPTTGQVPAPVQAPPAPVQAPPAPVQAPPAPEAPPAAQEPAPAPAPEAPQSSATKEITVKATAYTASCEGCSGITKTGVNLNANPDERVIAVDPSVIPLGSKVYIEGYGEATAADTGGAIKGNRIDIYMKNESDALQYGAKQVTVKILN